jgi:hypothetical protein
MSMTVGSKEATPGIAAIQSQRVLAPRSRAARSAGRRRHTAGGHHATYSIQASIQDSSLSSRGAFSASSSRMRADLIRGKLAVRHEGA